MARLIHRLNWFANEMNRMLVTEPVVTCIALYASFAYSLIYLTLEVFPIVFREHRHWNLLTSTLPFLGILIGVNCAIFVNVANQYFYKRAMKKNNGNVVPEARLPPIMVGGVLFSGGLFWFGWTAAPKYPWILPVLAAGRKIMQFLFEIGSRALLNMPVLIHK